MDSPTKTLTFTMQQAADISLSVALAGVAGVIPKNRAYELVNTIYAAHVMMIRDVLGGSTDEEIGEALQDNDERIRHFPGIAPRTD